MRKYISASLALHLLLFCFIVYPVFAGGTGSDQSPYDRLMSVEKWKVNLHLEYDNIQTDGSTEHAVSDWTGTLDIKESDIGHWYNRGGLDVTVNGVAKINAGKCQNTIVANGSEKYGFVLIIRKDGYVISQGYCNTQFGTSTMRCPTSVKTSKGSITYSQPWKMKVPLPEDGTTLSGKDTFTHGKPSLADRPLDKGESIVVKWELAPVGQKELKYRETALDVAAMKYYPGIALDSHVFIAQMGGGDTWYPHANFAGEVWVDGENKVKIRTGAGPAPLGLNGARQNVTSEYEIVRWARSWDMNKHGKVKAQWFFDSNEPIQDWIDNAGVNPTVGPPPNWNERLMDEFLVQVKGYSELGWIYSAFAMETRPNAYRIKYLGSILISEAQYKKIKASTEPYKPYPYTDKNKDKGWVELVQDPNTKGWKALPPLP